VLHLRLSTSEDVSRLLERELGDLGGVVRVISGPQLGSENHLLSADVEPKSADQLVALLERLEVGADDYVLTRLDVVAPLTSSEKVPGETATFAWIEVLGEARAHSRPIGRYLTLMAVSGVVAAIGVIKSNPILIVGAMAVSPDLLPICATCVGALDRRWRLMRRSLGTLVVGLALIGVVATALTAALEATGILAADFAISSEGVAGSLSHVDYSTVLVALAAGVAGMLAFETRAGAAVGVAISVTTIPASAYLGVSLGIGDGSEGLGALLVLIVNVVLLMVSGCLTLAVQRRASLRAGIDPHTADGT